MDDSNPPSASRSVRANPNDSRSTNKVDLLSAIGYSIDLRAPAPTAKDFSRLRILWTAYGAACALAAALSLRGMFAIMDGRPSSDFESLGYILASAASIATSGMALAYAALSNGLAKDSEFKTRAIELARKKHPDFEAYLAEVAAQGRELNAIEADAFIAEAGLPTGSDDLAMLDALEQRAALSALQDRLEATPSTQASRQALGVSERLNESSRELLAGLARPPKPTELACEPLPGDRARASPGIHERP